MSDMSSLLKTLYANDSVATSMEKTAEDNLLAALRGDNQVVEENPFDGMSTEDLIKIAEEMENGPSSPEDEFMTDEDTSLLEKTAAEMAGGQVMAHSMLHEFGLIKIAMLNGDCRVCKTNPMDIQGSSVCSGCAEAAGE